MKKIFICFTILIIFIPEARAVEQLPGIFHRTKPPAVLYVIEREGMSNADWHLAAVIQGMVNRERPRIYIVRELSESRGDTVLLSYYEKEYGVRNLGLITVEDALKEFSHLFKGYALFSFEQPWTVNIADTFCSIHDCLPVTKDQEALAADAGLEKMEDFRGRWKGPKDSVRWSLNNLFPKCSDKIVASAESGRHMSRDYFFAHRIYTFYLVASGDEYLALRKLLKDLPDNIPVMGYIARNGPEEWLVEYTLAEYGKFMVATNAVPNLTVHSGIPVKPLPELDQWSEPPDIKGKLGVVFAFTDGDNLYLESEYYFRPDYWLHPRRGDMKVTWSMAPQLYELAPGMIRYFYQTKAPNDFFVALSGAGYTFSSSFSDQEFFRRVSIQYLKLANLDILWNLDPKFYFTLGEKGIAKLMDPMGAEGYLKGVLAGYAPPVHMRDWAIPPGHPPIIFCKPNYFLTTNNVLLDMIRFDASLVPDRGRVVFYGVNNWEISYEDLLMIKQHLSHRKDIVFLSPQEAFCIIENWKK
jgi:hypothetical protein